MTDFRLLLKDEIINCNTYKHRAKTLKSEILSLIRNEQKLEDALLELIVEDFERNCDCAFTDEIKKNVISGGDLIRLFFERYKRQIDEIRSYAYLNNEPQLYVRPLEDQLYRLYKIIRREYLDEVYFANEKLEDEFDLYLQRRAQNYLFKAWIKEVDDGKVIKENGDCFPVLFKMSKDQEDNLYSLCFDELVEIVERNYKEHVLGI